ncbi:MAG: hypothetical protein LBM19_01280, partial [Holosporales bacterium]|nr:hypothetical protein [Holosporales bacterium]
KIPAEFLDVPEVEEAMNELQYVSQNPEMRKIYEERLRWQNNERNLRAHHYNKGVAEGRAEGELRKAKETALNALSMNLPLEQISKLTGLSSSEIESLKSR